ncbi:hypothetical protein [Spirosoma areae]
MIYPSDGCPAASWWVIYYIEPYEPPDQLPITDTRSTGYLFQRKLPIGLPDLPNTEVNGSGRPARIRFSRFSWAIR